MSKKVAKYLGCGGTHGKILADIHSALDFMKFECDQQGRSQLGDVVNYAA